MISELPPPERLGRDMLLSSSLSIHLTTTVSEQRTLLWSATTAGNMRDLKNGRSYLMKIGIFVKHKVSKVSIARESLMSIALNPGPFPPG